MSALSITTPHATRLRITPRGRRLLAVVAALPAVILLAYAVLSGGSALAARDAGPSASDFSTVTVAYGDTLWSIAEDVAPAADPRDVVDSLTRLNALPGGTIEVGQRIAIPAEYADAP